MTIPTWNLIEAEPRSLLDRFRAADNCDEMSVHADVDGSRRVTEYMTSTVSISCEDLIARGLLDENDFTFEDDGYGNVHVAYNGSERTMETAIDNYVSRYLSGDDVFEYADPHDSEVDEYSDPSFSDYYEWEG
tara:strand:- start:814 stop:1212 length:399 start_codon:yes stop_codon:yes gene_type:complete